MYRTMEVTNNYSSSSNPAFILDECSPDVVAKAAIDSGRQSEAFYVFDMNDAYHQIMRFNEVMPRVRIFYAMKANDTDMLLKLAVASGLGFDCASPREIDRILRLNVSPIILIRIRVDGDSVYKLGEKFGCDFETEAVDLLEEAAKLDLKVIGVAFHVGSACSSIESYALGLHRAKLLFEHEARAGRCMRILDIGGGFFNDSKFSIKDVAKVINGGIDQLFPDPMVQVIAELGRYICETAFTFYSPIAKILRVKKADKQNVNIIHLPELAYDSVKFFEHWYQVEKFKSPAGDEYPEDTIIWSIFNKTNTLQVQLPRCEINDWLVFRKQGAYTITFVRSLSQFEKLLLRPVLSTNLWNKIKQSPVFSLADFIADPDISEALPSILPPVIPNI